MMEWVGPLAFFACIIWIVSCLVGVCFGDEDAKELLGPSIGSTFLICIVLAFASL